MANKKVIKKKSKKVVPSIKRGTELLKNNAKAKKAASTGPKEILEAMKATWTMAEDSPAIPKEALQQLIKESNEKIKKPHTRHSTAMYPKMYLLAAKGYGIDSIALHLGVWPDTFDRWKKDHESFKYALKRCVKLCKEWWMAQGLKNIYNSKFNHVLWMMNMSNRFNWKTSHGAINKKVEGSIRFTEEQIQRTIQEVQIVNGNTAEVARILAEAGALESASTETIDAEADEIHSSHASS